LTEKNGTAHEIELLADTGNPFAVVISHAVMASLKIRSAPDVNTNFGVLEGGWVHLQMPELGLDGDVIGYASDAVVNSTQTSSPDFQGARRLAALALAGIRRRWGLVLAAGSRRQIVTPFNARFVETRSYRQG